MTLDGLKQLFELHNKEFLKFKNVTRIRHRRPDINAFMILDTLDQTRNNSGGFSDMVGDAEHDEIFLDADPEIVAKFASEDDIVDLIRCGVRYDESIDRFAMYV